MSTINEILWSIDFNPPWDNRTYTYNNSVVWELEKLIDLPIWIVWMHSSTMFSVYVVIAYLLTIYLGQIVMRNRQAFVLKGSLCTWNTFLAIFSFFGALRTVPGLMHSFAQENGFYSAVCMR